MRWAKGFAFAIIPPKISGTWERQVLPVNVLKFETSLRILYIYFLPLITPYIDR